jgi:small subunit ribosomal protein S1
VASTVTSAQETTADVAARPRLIPTADPHRKIVKPRHELEAEAKPPEPQAQETAEGSKAAEGNAAEATQGTQEEGSADGAAAGAPTPAEAAPKPAQPMYAPPVVLEIGAHFVGLVHNDGSRGGLIVLTHHPHRASKAKLVANQAFKDQTTVSALVTGVVKGGIEADFDGLRAFAPGSHMDLRLGTDLHRFIGKRLDFYVTQYGKRGRDVVLSRKAMLEAEAKAVREVALSKLTPGSTVEGTVRSVVSFGAFIDVGGVEGLVPLPEMSHNRSDTPSDVFKAGETVTVKVTRIDDKGKIWLSRRAAIPDPWVEVAKKYGTGTKHVGKVVRLQPFGAFIELEPGIDGLIHTADLSIKRIEDPGEVVKVGDSIDVVVASVDPGAHKIGLHPAPSGAAEGETPQRVQLHKPVKCAVVAVEAGGLVVRILGATGRHARGFITAAATGTPRGTELRKPFPVGTQLDAKVIEIDPKRGEVKLSIKALREDTERNAYQQYRAQVKQEAKFGTFADLLAKKISK